MIPTEIIKKIKKIHIKSLRLVNSEMAGQYKSVFRGSGIEFEEVREYAFGDDVKHIDWKVSSRLGKPFIKLYKEERESIVMLLIDMSRSSFFGTKENLKIETAAEVASILAFNAIKNNDKVGAIFFADEVEKYIPPKKGSAHIWRLIKEIFTFKPQSKKTNIENAVKYFNKVCRKKSVVFLISDFLDDDYIKSIKIASKKHEFINILLSDENDFHLPKAGIFLLKDLETDKQVYFDASDKKTTEAYNKLQTQKYHKQKENMKNAKIDCVEITTKNQVSDVLIKYFKIRERRKR